VGAQKKGGKKEHRPLLAANVGQIATQDVPLATELEVRLMRSLGKSYGDLLVLKTSDRLGSGITFFGST